MAQITRFPFTRHLRSDPSHHVLHFKRGRLVTSGRAWLLVPAAVGERRRGAVRRPRLAFLFHARTADFQDVTTQGVITYRVADAEKVAGRVDFSIDLVRACGSRRRSSRSGASLAARAAVRVGLRRAHAGPRRPRRGHGPRVRRRSRGLRRPCAARRNGLEIVAVRITGVAPTADLEKRSRRRRASRSSSRPTRRRSSVARSPREGARDPGERAAEQDRTREARGAAHRQEGQNAAARTRTADAEAIAADAAAHGNESMRARRRTSSARCSRRKVEAEKGRIDIYRDLPSQVLMASRPVASPASSSASTT